MVSEDHIVEEIGLLENKDYLPKGVVAFFKDLHRMQLETRKKLSAGNSINTLSVKQMEQKLKKGFHVLDLDRVKIEKGPLKILCEKVCEIMEEYAKQEAPEAGQLKRLMREDQLDLTTFIRNTALKDTDYFKSLSEQLQIDREYLYYLGIQVARPFFESMAQSVKSHIDEAVWKKGMCPICGNEPAMARLEREEGRRMLICFLCGTEWAYRRLQCPFCLNDNHETLRFFFADESNPYRVDVCDACKRYIKTVDERKLEEGQEVHLAIEDVATVFLDVLATDEGYRCPEHHILQLEKESAST